MNRRNAHAMGLVLLVAVMLAACGEAVGSTAAGDPTDAAEPTDTPADPGPAAGMCLEGATECVDTPQLNSDEPVEIDETGIEQFRKDAKFYLGRPRSELNELIRIARIDDEQRAVTDDYQVGRISVELDTVNDGGEPIVTSATVELPDGPETFELQQ